MNETDFAACSFARAKDLIRTLSQAHILAEDELRELMHYLLCCRDADEFLFRKAKAAAEAQFGDQVYIRGLIEFTNYCKNDCLYCGIRKSNTMVCRYRLDTAQILDCCQSGYALGFRTFVLQGGEDPYFSDECLAGLVRQIKKTFPDCALTLSAGERSRDSFRLLREAGADRYLLRHETACEAHYQKLHPPNLKLETRKRCLKDLKELGFQVGAGFMVGSPFQTEEHLVQDLLYLQELQPHMIGIGPFIPHSQTPFGKEPAGMLSHTLCMLALLRLMHPQALLPSTTALGTIHPRGRELGLLAGANVLMPNLSPQAVRSSYTLYDNKLCTGLEAAEGKSKLEESLRRVGRRIAVSRGDHPAKG